MAHGYRDLLAKTEIRYSYLLVQTHIKVTVPISSYGFQREPLLFFFIIQYCVATDVHCEKKKALPNAQL